MSILDYESKVVPDKALPLSEYQMTESEKATRSMILRHFALGDLNMQKPRFEFNDLSVVGRMQVDMMAFNTYQANNGDPAPGDEINGWRSNAMRPIVRNKCISIAAHAIGFLSNCLA